MDVSVLLEPTVNLERLAQVLDGLGHEGRVHAIGTWGKRGMAAIYEAAKGRPIDLDFLVPASVGPLVEVIHDGRNTLPIVQVFQKRFAKLESGGMVGYNHSHGISKLAGPGYFEVRRGEGEHEGELAIDYRSVPKEKPPGWPAIRPNRGLIAGPTFAGMVDYLRAVSSHVSVGRAFKRKPLDAWFALVRRDPG